MTGSAGDPVTGQPVRDDDLAEMAAAREVAVEVLCRGERKGPVNDRAQATQCYGLVHRLKIGAVPNADRSDPKCRIGQQ